MQVFLSHTSTDKDAVEAIGSFLTSRGLTVWIDSWRMTVGDSLVQRIGEGIESSDRLVVCLTPASVESNWVKKEVATGLVMELAEDKGLGDKFVVPALFIPCKVPVMLRDKLYANFTNKAFQAGCEELLAGVTASPRGARDARLKNGIVRTYEVSSKTPGNAALVVEFAVRISPTDGLHVGMDVGAMYKSVTEWFGPPNNPLPPANICGAYTSSSERHEPPIFARKFSTPNVTSTKSYYLLFESTQPFFLKPVQYLDYFDREP
ncbi:MAG: toll/interleukin-1 receptor domain-containing protein [Comamonadaceae bacterium]|nr:MAG: toll/interleukin-1 receptor domain-containing protein [Comamonadaceae bacterium]